MTSHGKQQNAIILATLLATLFLAALDFSAITTALPSMARELRSPAAYAWIGSAYLITSAAIAPVWGRVSDVWGRKWALCTSVAVFFAGSLTCALSRTAAVLILGRAIQGCGAGGIIVSVNICITSLWSARSRGFFLSTTGLVWALSSGIGPLLGGALSQYLSWRWLFWINLPVCFVTFVLLTLALDSEPSSFRSIASRIRSVDWIGSLGILGAAAMVLLSLDFGSAASPWNSAKVIGPLIGGSVLFGSFLLWEGMVAKEPIVPLRLLSSWHRASPLLVCFTHGFVNMSSWYFLPVYFQAVLGASPTRSGALILPIVLVQACLGVVAGAFIHHFGRIREIVWIGAATMTLGFGLFISLGSSTPFGTVAVLEIIAGVGVGIIFQAPLLAYQSFVDENDINVATALFGFIRSLSTTISVVVGDVIFQNGMEMQQPTLKVVLEPEIAQNFTASLAAPNALQVHLLPAPAKAVVEEAYVHSLRQMWILYTSVASVGLFISLFVMPKVSFQAHRPTTAGTDPTTDQNN